MRFPGALIFSFVVLATASTAGAQSTVPVMSQSLPAQPLAPGGPAVTIDLRNYFAVPGIAPGGSVAPYDTVFPTGGGTSVITLVAENSGPAVVGTVLSGSTLTLMPVAPGNATITVRATDPNGAAASGSFVASVAGTAPVFTFQPRSQTIAAGSTVVFSAPAVGGGSFRWERNGQAIPDATTSTLVINRATAADAGTYTLFASNDLGVTASDSATLQVVNVAPVDAGRLTNLSILNLAGAGDKVLTVGAVIGPFDLSARLPIVFRAVGPTLAQAPYNVPDPLPDPVMTFYAAGNETPIDTNDNWGGGEPMRAAFESVAAFALPTASLDSAVLRASPGVGVGGYTVQVTGKGAAQGAVLAEIYDAAGAARTNTSPRLINVSTLAQVDAQSDLAVGFVIGGQTARTVLVRGAGPSLTRVGVTGVMADPQLELYDNNTGVRIGGNDNWSGALEISNAGGSVGAFMLAGGTSKDAALLVTLPPGPYSARVSGVGSTGGVALVEVYEVP